MKPKSSIVKLVDCTKEPFNLSIATARTCYSSKGILYSEDMIKTPKSIEIRDKVAKSTKKAGHLTTRQHPQFIFTLDRVSRYFVWAFLHSHPYYNSEQVSQRYVEVKKDNFYIPNSLSSKRLELYLDAIKYSMNSYFEFLEILNPYITNEFISVSKARTHNPEIWQNAIQKKCMEIARYFLPLGTFTYLYHTINGLTLHRYYRLVNSFHVPKEQKDVISSMVEEVRKIDPKYIEEMDDPIPLESTVEYEFFQSIKNKPNLSKEFIAEFDNGLENRYSRLVSYQKNTEQILADSFRATLGIPSHFLSNEDAIANIMSSENNKHLTSTLNESTVSPISRSMFMAHYTFKKKISHTADSQDQRHRMVPGARPILFSQYTGEADYIIPVIIQKYDVLREKYTQRMTKIFENINCFLEQGGDKNESVYLYPNAIPVRFYEGGDLLNLYHKWKARLCYNSQEEIFHASVQEVMDLQDVHPGIAKWIGAPCMVRKMGNEKPFCPEGDKYCGVQVWKKLVNDYQRVI
ncbi:MAG: FAD-dependent thymidylate synthase [Leptospiraceae bacterium]|nr:FAD-dependent thymidylate synthase [Leptospiraceae bacterium]MCP5497076.1 FAD-dependent thymidylate synthase [Leptospiraceae bacterium]